jgi:hypothetical protein
MKYIHLKQLPIVFKSLAENQTQVSGKNSRLNLRTFESD